MKLLKLSWIELNFQSRKELCLQAGISQTATLEALDEMPAFVRDALTRALERKAKSTTLIP